MNSLTPMMNRYIFFFVLLTFSFSFASADDGGSGYSRYGIGDIRYFTSSRAAGMGGAGTAVMSSNSIDQLNPANLARITSVRYAVGLMYEGFSTTDGINSAMLSTISFNSLMITLPVDRSYGLVVGLGISPYSKVNYSIVTPVVQGGLDYTLRYRGYGGLSQAHLGLSSNLGSDFHVGAKLNYYFGTVHHTIAQAFNSGSYANGDVEHSTRYRGAGFTFGAVYTGLKKAFHLPETGALNIGIRFSTVSYLSATDENFFSYSSGTLTTRDTTSTPSSNVRIPLSFGTGISYSTDRWLFAGDFFYQNWNNFDARGGKPAELRDSYRFSAGTELLPKRDLSLPFIQRVAYRGGFFYDASYYQINGKPINEFGITAGFALPIFSETKLDIGAEYSFRGTTDNQLQKDNILRISFTLSGSEPWFVRAEEE